MALTQQQEAFAQFLALAFFRSPNYVPGVSGWTINQDGSAEFNNLTVRGTFQGDQSLILDPGPLLEYGNTNLNVVVLAGSGNWTAPAGVVSPITRYAIGAGGGTPATLGVSPGGGGGGSAVDTAPVTALSNYAYVVGQGAAGANGGDTTMVSDAQTITAHGGKAATAAVFGNGGVAGANGFAGGNGGGAGFSSGGGSGGGGAGTSTPGHDGAHSAGATGPAGGFGGSGFVNGGNGGAGGNNAAAGNPGVGPGGAAGGSGSGDNTAEAGANGIIVLVYTTTGGTTGLVNSIAVAPGTDPGTGTAYQGGVVNYNPAFGSDIQLYQGQLKVSTLTGTSAVQFSNSLLHLIEQPPDGNTYSLERLTLLATGQLVNSAVFTNILGWPVALAVGTYHLRGQIITTTGVAGGQGEYKLVASGGLVLSAMGVTFSSFAIGSPTALANSGRQNALGSSFTDTVFGAAQRQITIDGIVTVSTAGTLVPQVAVAGAGDTFTINTPDSYLEVFPL